MKFSLFSTTCHILSILLIDIAFNSSSLASLTIANELLDGGSFEKSLATNIVEFIYLYLFAIYMFFLIMVMPFIFYDFIKCSFIISRDPSYQISEGANL